MCFFYICQPGAALWIDKVLTDNQKDIIENATISLTVAQLYNQRILMTTKGPQILQAERLNVIRNQSQCISEHYRCRTFDKSCWENNP